MAPIQHQQQQPSLLHKERIAQYVSLSPAALATPLPALCATIFSPLLLSYFPPAKGIVLAYEDVQLSDAPPTSTFTSLPRAAKRPHRRTQPQQPQNQHNDSDLSDSESDTDTSTPAQPLLLRHIDEYAAPFLWASATFLVVRPQRGASLTARITHQARSHITLAYLNLFPVTVVAGDLPASWAWRGVEGKGVGSKGVRVGGGAADEGGCWVIGGGEEVTGGREFEVRIRDFDGRLDGRGKGKGFLRIEGVVEGKGE